MTETGPIQVQSDARAWSGSTDDYPFEVRAEMFVYSREANTGSEGAVVLEAGDEFVDDESDGASSYSFRCAERTTEGSWTLVWDIASSDVNHDGRVASGGPAIWAKRLREDKLVPADEWGEPASTGVQEL
jgi:hypothetical protein